MNRQLASFLISGIFLLGFAPRVKSESESEPEGVLDKIQRTGVLKIAIREDAPPFGYLTASGNLQGYCLDFFALLERQLNKELQRDTLSIKLYKSTPVSRFTLVEKNTVDLECGPNTIPKDSSRNVNFSNSFFVTGTQFLVKRENEDLLDREQLEGIRLGVIDSTATAELIAERYPLATVREYSGVTARIRGIQAVAQNQIDGMVSDGILLRAAAQQEQLSSLEYSLIPDIPLSCDRYGMIIKNEDPQWQDFVNSVIDSPEAATLSNTWFGQLFGYVKKVGDFCR